jgi:hypothetical protein
MKKYAASIAVPFTMFVLGAGAGCATASDESDDPTELDSVSEEAAPERCLSAKQNGTLWIERCGPEARFLFRRVNATPNGARFALRSATWGQCFDLDPASGSFAPAPCATARRWTRVSTAPEQIAAPYTLASAAAVSGRLWSSGRPLQLLKEPWRIVPQPNGDGFRVIYSGR